jgi:ribosome biogenesis protein BRX1
MPANSNSVHTMDELNFTGNCLKGSRPILSFDCVFDQAPHLRVIKELFLHVFGVPQGARKSKPFVDHVLCFSVADGKIWVRNYQIDEVEKTKGDHTDDEKSRPQSRHLGKDTDIKLVEIGPRFVLTPVVIQEGSFGGPIIYENKEFVSPNQVRAELRRKKATKYNVRAEKQLERRARKENLSFGENGAKKVRNALDTRKLFS